MRVASSTDRCIGRGVRVVLLGGFVYVVTAILGVVCHMRNRSSDGYTPKLVCFAAPRPWRGGTVCGHAAAGARAHRI